MGVAADPRALRLSGRVLILLALRNELRLTRAPAWRLERNRLEIDRAVAELAHDRHEGVTEP
jgi:hypothetical protein